MSKNELKSEKINFKRVAVKHGIFIGSAKSNGLWYITATNLFCLIRRLLYITKRKISFCQWQWWHSSKVFSVELTLSLVWTNVPQFRLKLREKDWSSLLKNCTYASARKEYAISIWKFALQIKLIILWHYLIEFYLAMTFACKTRDCDS